MDVALLLTNLMVAFRLTDGATITMANNTTANTTASANLLAPAVKKAEQATGQKPILGRCVDCANNVENYKSAKYRDPARACINDGHGLACANEGLRWICALTDDLKKQQCHESYVFELWCNQAHRENALCDGKEKYVPQPPTVNDGRLKINGKWVGPDGKYNSFDDKVLVEVPKG